MDDKHGQINHKIQIYDFYEINKTKFQRRRIIMENKLVKLPELEYHIGRIFMRISFINCFV